VIIGNLNVFHAIIRPDKTNAELIVDPYAVLTLSIMLKGFQKIPWGNFQRFQGNDPIELIKLTLCYTPDLLWTGFPGFFGISPVEDILCALIAERFYHQVTPSLR